MQQEVMAILDEYTQMRQSGVDAREALRYLTPRISGLNDGWKDILSKRIRTLEESGTVPPPADQPRPKIKPLKSMKSNGAAQGAVAEASYAGTSIQCPHCGRPNPESEVICYACGQFMPGNYRSIHDTNVFNDPDNLLQSDEYFGPTSMLALVIKSTNQAYKLQPQTTGYDIVIGRSAEGAIQPDIDLNDQDGAQLGVSRLHIALRYDPQNNTIAAADMGSANGSFINGQRMHRQEIRILRHGDELRLGKLILKVMFYHPRG